MTELSRADSQRIHALRRARLRVSADVKMPEILEIERGIRNGSYEVVRVEEDRHGILRRTVYAVELRGKSIHVVYDHETEAAVTVMPPEYHNPKRKRQVWTLERGWTYAE